MINMFLSNNPSSGDINLLNLSCLSCFSPVSNCLIRTIVQVFKSGIHLTFTIAMVAKMAPKVG